jgi:hypothetical protein
MDRKSPQKPEIQQLIDLSAAARSCLTCEARALRQRLDIPARIRNSVKCHPASWLLGSLASGIAASFAFRRKPRTTLASRRTPSKMLGFVWTAARPLVKIWLADQVKHWLAGQAFTSPAGFLQARFSPTRKSF